MKWRCEQHNCPVLTVNHLCQLWSLPSEVEDVLLLAKVLDDNLETVWPGTHDKQWTGFRRVWSTSAANECHLELTCQTDCRARHTRSTRSDRSALWVWLLSFRSQSRWAGRRFPPGWSRGFSTACLCLMPRQNQLLILIPACLAPSERRSYNCTQEVSPLLKRR